MASHVVRVPFAAAALALAAASARAELTPEWITTFPLGPSWYSGVAAMVVDPAGVMYVAGTTGSSSNSDVITTAIATDGTILWQRTFDGPAAWHDQGRGIALGPNGVVYVVGNTPDAMSYANVLLLKYDAANGTLLNTVQHSSGPFTSEHGGSVAVDAQGNVYVAGGTVGDGSDALMLKFDSAGVRQWTRTWDGPAFSPYSGDNALAVRIAPSGEPIVLIHGVMNSLHPDYVVLKLAPNDGSTLWQANWGVSGGDFPVDIELDALGDVYVTGTGIDFIDKYSTIKLRGSDGQLLWQAYDAVAADHSARALALDGQGGVYVTGSADPEGNHSNFNDDFYTVKRDAATGALLWTHRYGQPCVGCYDVPSDVVVDGAGHVYVSGTTSSAPYSSDTITFVLDAATGVETERGVIASTPQQAANANVLRLDAAANLYGAGSVSEPSTGASAVSTFKYGHIAPPPGVPFCAGDGTAAACPCANESALGGQSGCRNSLGEGARLTASGAPTLSSDTLVLLGERMPNSTALYIQGTQPLAGGAGAPFGDGLRCAGGTVVRLGARSNVGGASQYPASGDAPVSVRGLVPGPGERAYQVWYRNAAAFCTPSTFNLSNGVLVTWRP